MAFNFDIANEMLEQARSELDFTSVTPSDTPYLIILGGQPGSGKSSAIEKIEERFDDNIIALNGDDFKTTYPGYDALLAKDPIKASEEVQPYSNYVVNQLKNDYANKKFNLIIEGTMRTIEVPLSTINEFKAKGYQTEACVVTSNYYASRAGCIYRMEMDIADNGHGRAVPIESHDAAYNNIPDTINNLISSGKLDNLTIISRSGEVLGTLNNGDDVLSIYTSHRNQLTHNEYKQINIDLHKVVNMMQNRGASKADICQATDLQNQLKLNFGMANQ